MNRGNQFEGIKSDTITANESGTDYTRCDFGVFKDSSQHLITTEITRGAAEITRGAAEITRGAAET